MTRCRKKMKIITKRIVVLASCILLSLISGCASFDSANEVVELKNKDMSVKFYPAAGGKIISIKDSNDNEFLSRSDRAYKKRILGMKYGDTEFDGIDECFPSMAGCAYPAEPYKGKPTGDHGETSQLPWKRIKGKGVILQVTGVNFPYVFTRQATLDGKTLVLDYTVRNTGDAPLYHSYVFHPLFKGETGCFIEFEPATEVKLLYSSKGFLGKMNSKVNIGEIKDKDGKSFQKNMFIKDSNRYYKFVVGKLQQGEAVLKYKDGTGIKMTWPVNIMPYMAVWCSENGVKGLNHLAPEPAVSAFDSLAQAYINNEAQKILGGGTQTWRIKISLLGD